MNKSEFIDAVAEKAKLSKKDAKSAVDAVLETITETLVKNETVSFIGFGAFSTIEKGSRVAKVPGTERTVEVAATTAVKFKIGKDLKSQVAAK